MIGAVSSVGAGQSVAVTREMRDMLNALAAQQAAELKLATLAVRGSASVQKQETAGLIDVMA
jgi:hypothetical protein